MSNNGKKYELDESPVGLDPDKQASTNRKGPSLLSSRLPLAQPFGYQTAELPPDLDTLFRQLIAAAPPPAGMPRLGHVLENMAIAVEGFVKELVSPNQEILAQASNLKRLGDFCSKTANPILDYTIPMRRMKNFQAWQFFMQDDRADQEVSRQKVVAGAALVLAIVEGARMSNELASLLVRSAKETLSVEQERAIARRSNKVLVQAARQFETDAKNVSNVPETFEDRLRSRFRSTLFNARDREHQAIADHRASSRVQMLEAAKQLRERAEGGEALALFLIVASLTNLPESIAIDLPLLRDAPEDWVMVVDIDSGCLKVSIDLYAPARATSKISSSHSTLDAGDVVVIPLPTFAASALDEYAEEFPDSKTLGDLLGQSAPQKFRPLTSGASGIAATAARFRNGLGPLAIEAKIDRYDASILLSNPLLTPTGKFYYARVTREAVWDAAKVLYDTLDWGLPTDFQPGLATGSRQVASDATVLAWASWLAEQLHACKLPRRYTLEKIIEHHNVLALVCASLSTFLLALRARKVLPITQAMITGGGLTVPIFDKRVGQFPGARPVPVCTLQGTVFASWSRHLQQMTQRLTNVDSVSSRDMLKRIHANLNPGYPAFFEINQRGRIDPIGTERIHAWWPEELGLARNFGRHFWQNRLREEGVQDTEIDAFVRHSVSGMDTASSISNVVTADWARRMIVVADHVVKDLGIGSIIDLTL